MSMKLLGIIPAEITAMEYEVEDPDNPGQMKRETRLYAMVHPDPQTTGFIRLGGLTFETPSTEEEELIREWVGSLMARSKIVAPNPKGNNLILG